MDRDVISLIGFMGAGKSAVGAALADMLGYRLIETDALIAEKAGMTIPEVFSRFGEERFRDLETETVAGLAGSKQAVVSCGGGVVLREENVSYLKQLGVIVLLSATAETVYARVSSNSERPLLKDGMTVSHISEMLEKRREYYEKAADFAVPTDGDAVSGICRKIMSKLGLE